VRKGLNAPYIFCVRHIGEDTAVAALKQARKLHHERQLTRSCLRFEGMDESSSNGAKATGGKSAVARFEANRALAGGIHTTSTMLRVILRWAQWRMKSSRRQPYRRKLHDL